MYETLKEVLLELFKAPTAPPSPPMGQHGSVQIFRASPNYLSYQYLFFYLLMFGLVIGVLIATVALMQGEMTIGLIAGSVMAVLWVLIAVGGYFVIRLEYDMRYYLLTDRSMRIRKGVIHIVEQTLTFVNIQNIQVEQGPIERMFGISSVVVETAGGGSGGNPEQGGVGTNYHRAVLNGLENGEAVRDLILNYLKRLPHTSGLGEPEEHRTGTGHGFSAQEVEALRGILQEVREMRGVLGR